MELFRSFCKEWIMLQVMQTSVTCGAEYEWAHIEASFDEAMRSVDPFPTCDIEAVLIASDDLYGNENWLVYPCLIHRVAQRSGAQFDTPNYIPRSPWCMRTVIGVWAIIFKCQQLGWRTQAICGRPTISSESIIALPLMGSEPLKWVYIQHSCVEYMRNILHMWHAIIQECDRINMAASGFCEQILAILESVGLSRVDSMCVRIHTDRGSRRVLGSDVTVRRADDMTASLSDPQYTQIEGGSPQVIIEALNKKMLANTSGDIVVDIDVEGMHIVTTQRQSGPTCSTTEYDISISRNHVTPHVADGVWAGTTAMGHGPHTHALTTLVQEALRLANKL